MKQPVLFILWGILLFSGWSCSEVVVDPAKESKIFFVNLFNEPVDVRLGEKETAVFISEKIKTLENGLEPYSASVLVRTQKFGSYPLYFKKSIDTEYYTWAGDTGEAYQCTVEIGKNHCIVLLADGMIEYFTLQESYSKNAQVSFFNGTNRVLNKMEIAPDYNNNTAVYVEYLNENSLTDFIHIAPGTYGIFWQLVSQDRDEYYYYPDQTGKKAEMWNLEENGYYLFLSFIDDYDEQGAYLFNITPGK